jgi:phosphatidylglycerol lysyltransferase
VTAVATELHRGAEMSTPDMAPILRPGRRSLTAQHRSPLRWLWPGLTLAIGALALFTLRRELHAYGYHQIMRAAWGLPALRVWTAVGFTILGYTMLAGYDALALEYVGRPLGPRRTVFASFVAYALSINVGFSAITGASIRYRFWSAWGLSAPEIAQGVAFTTVTFWLGVLAVGGAALLFGPAPNAALHAFSPVVWRIAGAVLLAAVVAYVVWAAMFRRTMTLRGWAFTAPRPALAIVQVLTSSLDWILAGLTLFVLMPRVSGLSATTFVGFFLVAQIIAVVSHVPGGVGVFETLMLLMLKPWVATPDVIGALVAYRAVYYLLPLAIAVVAFASHELLARRERVARMLRVAGRWVPGAAPYVLSVTTFAAGVVLLISGATPSIHSRVVSLHQVLPLPVLELSHFTGSIAGIALVFLARGIRQRLDAAWHLTVATLLIGIAASLLKGLDYEEAILLAIVLAAVLPARDAFYRRAALTAEPFSPRWIVAVLLVLGGTLSIGLFAFKHVDYSNELWWKFAVRADAPRFLRAQVGATVFAMAIALWRLVRPARVTAQPASAEQLERILPTIRRTSEAMSNLALLGDKALFMDESGDAFIMYGVEGRSWVALGDPVGSPEEREDLAWKFRETAYRSGGRPVFYEVKRENLPLYVDLGLTLLKLGEQARVPLEGFSLDGKMRAKLRQPVRFCEKQGCRFSIVPAAQVPELLPQLRVVSDGWLAMKRTREKGFSLGRFDEKYLSHFPLAVVHRGDEIIAFANVLAAGTKAELSIDLMRHVPDAPNGIMDYLFVQLMFWGAEQGYRWFNLGMAPMSGFEPRALAPAWARIGSLLFSHGEHFYNFRGLRRYKEKFQPLWEPRYLAAPGGLALPAVLTNVAALISGGLAGVIAR